MKKFLALFLSAALIAFGNIPAFASSANESENSSEYVPNEVIVMQKTASAARSYSAESISLPFTSSEIIDTSAIDSAAGTSFASAFSVASAYSGVRVIKGTVEYGTDIEKLCNELEKRSDIISADPNYIEKISDISIPSEALESGSDYNEFNAYKNSLALADAWESADTLGSENITVGVIDTGVNISHKEFEGKMWDDGSGNCGWNAVDGDNDVSDANGHGSNVAGIIGMSANNYGYVGIAPNVKIMALKASDGTSLTDSNILECLNYALENGADVINMSFGSSNISTTMAAEYQKAARKTVLVAAAGNSSADAEESAQYPAAYNGVIGVMSYGSYKNADITNYTNYKSSQLSSFSNYDASGNYYQLAAPGVKIEGPSCADNSSFTLKSGTSQAAPMVAGTAALYLSLYPDADSYQVRQAIINGAEDTLTGYYDSGTYKKLNIKSTLLIAPCEDKTLNLSADAESILSDIYGETFSEIKTSDLDALNLISSSNITAAQLRNGVLKELNTVKILNLSSMSLTDDDFSWISETQLPRLSKLDLSKNSSLSNIGFTDSFAPRLINLSISDCNFSLLEPLTVFKNLRFLYAQSNKFITSLPAAKFTKLKYADFSYCALQDTDGFADIDGLLHLDVSDNYLTDVSPLECFRGIYLDISYNPLNLGENSTLQTERIENFMNDNAYTYNSVRFIHSSLNGDAEATYIQGKNISMPGVSAARTDEKFTLEASIAPSGANTDSYCTYSSADSAVTLNKYTGEMNWNKSDFPNGGTVSFTVNPVSGFPSFTSKIDILAPEIQEFSYSGGVYTLAANKACESVKIGSLTLSSYTSKGESRYFTVPSDLTFSETLSAVPSDSLGSGSAVLIGTKHTEAEGSAKIISFTSDKAEYSSGNTALLSITASPCTNSVKVKDCRANKEIILTDYETSGENRIFSLSRKLCCAESYKFKAYASCGNDYPIGASVLNFKALQSAQSFSLTSENGANLYFADGRNTASLKAVFYPSDAESGTALKYSSSDPSVISVDSSGTLTAQSYGTAVITAESDNGLKAYFAAAVNQPMMSDVDVTAGNYNEDTTFELYTSGASDIKICNTDGSDAALGYTVSKTSSGIVGYDTKWTLTAVIGTYAQTSYRIYACDSNGADADKSPFKDISFTCTNPMTDFDISSAKTSYDRNGGAIKISLARTPADSNSKVSWSVSSTALASISAYHDYALLTPKGTGTLTITASGKIDGESVEKSINLTLTDGKIYSAEFESETPQTYKAFNVTVRTSKTMQYINLYDSVNLIGRDYSGSIYYTDTDTQRIWTLPFFFMSASSRIRIWGGDTVGNITEPLYYDINASAPSSDTLASSEAYYIGTAGETAAFSAIMLPSKSNISADKITVSIADTSIASYSGGNISFLKAGKTTLSCTYGDYTVDVPISVYAPVTAISFPDNNITLPTGSSYTLAPDITPSATSDTLTFSSADSSIASVDSEGKVSAVSKGDTVITLTSSGGISASVSVRVRANEQLSSIAFEKSAYDVSVGNMIYPRLITDKSDYINTIKYSVSNPNIMSVSSGGVCTANKSGTITLKAETDNGLTAQTTLNITSQKRLSLTMQYIETYVRSVVIIGTVLRPGSEDLDGVWFSDNDMVATVTQGGYISAKSAGICNIFFLSDSGECVSCPVKVNSLAASRINISDPTDNTLSLGVNENFIVEYSVSPSGADENLSWSSSDESVAAVNSAGIITGIKKGDAVITAALPNGKTYTINVSVSAEECSLCGNINGGTELALTDSSQSVSMFAVDNNFNLESISKGTYDLKFSKAHHVSLTILETDIFGVTDIGDVTLANGDANSDGSVNINDISEILQSKVYGTAATDYPLCDINDDGNINISDISEILLAENYGAVSQEITF